MTWGDKLLTALTTACIALVMAGMVLATCWMWWLWLQ